MDFTTEQAKSIFDLIKSVSPYAYPLLISLIFPIIWFSLKKILDIQNSTKANMIVFYGCIILFFGGGVLLKFGEYNEEIIRQKALALKKYFESRNYTFLTTENLNKRGFDNNLLDNILYNYPSDFVRTEDDIILCTDPTVKKTIIMQVYPLFESYLNYKLRYSKGVFLDSLWQSDETRNIKNFFTYDIMYGYLSENLNKGKYMIDVIENRDFITLKDSLE